MDNDLQLIRKGYGLKLSSTSEDWLFGASVLKAENPITDHPYFKGKIDLKCPRCKTYLTRNNLYCHRCGLAVDVTNIAEVEE